MTRFVIALHSRCHVVVPSVFLKQMNYSISLRKVKSKYFSLEPALGGALCALSWQGAPALKCRVGRGQQ